MSKLGQDYQYEITLHESGEAYACTTCDSGAELDRYVEDGLSTHGSVPTIRLVQKQKQEEPSELTKAARRGSGFYEEET